ncbi:MAG: hypothetical protein ABIQ04_01670 [Candidatus Saccharimonadales bacterium]
MTDRETQPSERMASGRSVARIVFSPSENLKSVLQKFSLSKRSPVLRTSRMVELSYEGGDSDGPRYTPDDARWLSDTEKRLRVVTDHHQPLASYVLTKTLSRGDLGIDLRLLPSNDDLERLHDFTRNEAGVPVKYLDVHAIIPVNDRAPVNSMHLDYAIDELEQLLATHHPAFQRPDQLIPAPRINKAYAFGANIMSRVTQFRSVR